MDWFTANKKQNEDSYGEYCEHKDRVVMTRDYPINYTGKSDVVCRSCGARAEWNGKDYSQKLPKTKWKGEQDA